MMQNTKINQLKDQLRKISEISANNSLYDTAIENFPQAVLAISFCFASLEHGSVRVWLKSSLIDIFNPKIWATVASTIAFFTIFGLVSTVLTNR